MRKLFFLLLIPASFLFPQNVPIQYNFDNYKLSKTNDATPTSNSIEKIIYEGNTLWLATGSGLSKSTDNGETWTNYYKTRAFGEEGISAIGYHDGIIWAATWHLEDKIGTPTPYGSGLRYSTDEGTTWHEVSQPVDQETDTVEVYGINKLKVLPVSYLDQNFVRQMAFTQNTIWIAASAGGLRKSTDMGQSWQRIVVPPDNLNSIKPTDTLDFSIGPPKGDAGNLNYIGYSVFAVNDSTIYFGTYGGGINKTTDGGKSWVKFNHENEEMPIGGTQIMDIAYNEFDKSIWAATWKLFGDTELWCISFSKDGGLSWETTLNDSRTFDFGFKYYGSPGNYTGVDIFAATEDGLYRSSNSGLTWISAPTIIDDVTKQEITSREFRAVVPVPRIDNSYDIWIGSNDGLARLNETNSNWTGNWKVFIASNQKVSANETFAFPNPFSPNNEVVRIKYKIESSSDVTIRIFDFGMNLVRTLIQNASRGANDDQIEIWNGKDEKGKFVPNGVYFYRIDIGSNAPIFGKIMVIM